MQMPCFDTRTAFCLTRNAPTEALVLSLGSAQRDGKLLPKIAKYDVLYGKGTCNFC